MRIVVLLIAATLGWMALLTYLVSLAAGWVVAAIFAALTGLTLFFCYALLAGSKTGVRVEIDSDEE